MPPFDEQLTPEIELMTRVAFLYYFSDVTQNDIAKQLGLSRPKVGRLLKRARELGIVEIRVNTHPALNIQLEQQLKERFNLQHVLLAGVQSDPAVQRFQVARMVASFLARTLKDHQVVAVGMGRNTGAIPDGVDVINTSIRCHFVSAIGGSPQYRLPINPNDICRRLAEVFGGDAESLYAPAYAATSEIRDMLQTHDQIHRTLERARHADFALVGIGDARDDSAVVQMGCFTSAEMKQLREEGAVGDIFGSFFDVAGKTLSKGIKDRVVGLSLDDLRRIPYVIGTASEPDKAAALLGALRCGVLDILATTTENAQAILALDS